MHSDSAQSLLLQIGALHTNATERLLQTPHGELTFEDLLTDITRMQSLAGEIATQSNTQIDAGVATLRERTALMQRLLLWGLALLISLSVAAILLFSLLLSRPLRQIDHTINELGRGAFAQPIHISGPKDLERLGKQLEWLRLRLLDLAQERNRFLRHMSHELKTPLANIREGTELLMDGAVGKLEHGQREVIGILRENGIRLQRMIENLLSFSAWQTSSVGLEISQFRLQPLVKQIIENQQLAMLSRRLRLDVSVQNLNISADRGKLRLILENLLSNAVKYAPLDGAILIRACAEDGNLVLEVADTGPGIPLDERPYIFDAFYSGQAPGGHVRGTGIGLSVVLEFVVAHQGKIQIIDGDWSGAHFRIQMPLHTIVELPQHEPTPTKQESAAHAAT
jgi:two-component system sensor histidine kinase GlrK